MNRFLKSILLNSFGYRIQAIQITANFINDWINALEIHIKHEVLNLSEVYLLYPKGWG